MQVAVDIEQLNALEPLTYQDFAPYISQAFIMTEYAEAPVNLPLQLIEAEKLGTSAFAGYRDNFILIFSDATRVHRQQAMCTLQHPAKGAVSLFLIPISQDTQAIYYQAVFA